LVADVADGLLTQPTDKLSADLSIQATINSSVKSVTTSAPNRLTQLKMAFQQLYLPFKGVRPWIDSVAEESILRLCRVM
jgi:hypothetical protein